MCSTRTKSPFSLPSPPRLQNASTETGLTHHRSGAGSGGGGGGGGRKRPFKGPGRSGHRNNHNRNHRLCLMCGNYHGGDCNVPICSMCELSHYAHMSCLNTATNIRSRLAMNGGLNQGNAHVRNTSTLSSISIPLLLLRKSTITTHLCIESHLPGLPKLMAGCAFVISLCLAPAILPD